MTLPKRVQADLQAAEALEAKIQQERAQPDNTVADAAALVATPPPNEPQSAPPEPVAPEPPPPPPQPREDFEQKYRTLQGKYSAEVPQLQRQLNELNAQHQRMLAEQAKREQKAEPQAADPKDIENFGADLIEMVRRYIGQQDTAYEQRFAALEQKVSGVSHQSATTLEQTFYATLDQLVPDWKDINTDQRWLAWLGETDPVYGAPRQAALDAAHERMDVQRVANVFRAYKASLPPPAKPPSSLANQVAPSGAASAQPTAAPAKPVLSQKAITDFYNDLGRGRYAGREAEAASIEAEINLAVAEGRVR